ncbi:MAG: 2-C-methyl-D-erythritol 4-phosphate cytidylyltransferase [Thermoflavifilum sp.]|nr:2-C-methyl-D-erythritol 4-phosphate cytidylyltransferase [Thermoflavifilum sp.]MCL6514306.1 2-C-methyl-D-erythritol 4-phosphate cytidylyltransferase [Alicyclobacillus sp.]
MIYALILAAGKGTRMGNVDLPKQFMQLGSRPIVIHTVEKFMLHDALDRIIVVAPQDWLQYTTDILNRYIGHDPRLMVTAGGPDRNESIMNALRYVDKQFGIQADDIVITHDSVRPFVTRRIIEENIQYALETGAVDTVIPAIDTIVKSTSGQYIDEIPYRTEMYQGQTPQSFNARKLMHLYGELSAEERSTLTDACKIFTLRQQPVRLVRGEVFNIKITTPYDLKVAEALLEGGTHH